MIKTVAHDAVEKSTLRKKGWKLFGLVVVLQMLFMIAGYLLQTSM